MSMIQGAIERGNIKLRPCEVRCCEEVVRTVRDNPGLNYKEIREIMRAERTYRGPVATYLAILVYNGDLVKDEKRRYHVKEEVDA